MVYIEQEAQEPNIEESRHEQRERSRPPRRRLFGRSVFLRWFLFGALTAVIVSILLLSIGWSTLVHLLEVS